MSTKQQQKLQKAETDLSDSSQNQPQPSFRWGLKHLFIRLGLAERVKIPGEGMRYTGRYTED